MATEAPAAQETVGSPATAGSKEFTVQEVAEHSTKKDLYFIIHDKVYDSTSFADEHPGGEEVLVDLGGQDATEAFEDVGHSDEAREILAGLLVGTVKGAKPASSTAAPVATHSAGGESGIGLILYAVVFVGGLIAYVAYQYLQPVQAAQEQK
ncbi:hypothetical protein DV737_g5532, partial [Chaetothyriales sp. CBS 132003]